MTGIVEKNWNAATGIAFVGTREFRRYLVICVGVLLLLFLVLRNGGLYAVVVDETLYSKFSRLVPFAESAVPGYLYLALFRMTNICGDAFLDCARVLNVVVFLAAAPFIYLSARKTCGQVAAAAVTLLALVGPINVYTAYFMPEALYFLCFWVLTWYALNLDRNSTPRSFAVLGLLFGLCALVKPHAILFMPALLVFAWVATRKPGAGIGGIVEALKGVAAFLACAMVLKFGVGYAVAGRAGLTLMGTAYGSMAHTGLASLSHYLEIVAMAMDVAQGHLIALALMFGMPIAAGACVTLSSIVRRRDASTTQTALYSTLILGCLLIVVALFTATVPYADPNQAVNRLHMRYYNFALPLLLIVAAGFLRQGAHEASLAWRLCTAIPVGLFAVYGLAGGLVPYESSYVDNPELRGFVLNGRCFKWLAGLSIAALVAWVADARLGARLYVFIYAPAFALLASASVNADLGQRKTPDIYDRAGIVANNYLADEDISKLVVVGSDPAGLLRAAMYLDNPNVVLKEVPAGTRVEFSELPEDREWVLTVGDVALAGRRHFEVSMDDFALARIVESATLTFDKTSWPGLVSKTQGLSGAEPWGAWSTGKVATIAFKRPLPARFAVHLKGRAFASAPHDEFVMHAGSNSKSFKLAEGVVEEKVLEFDNASRSNLIRIDIPNPMSPKARGLGEDDRLLGIAFYELRIEPL